MLTVLESEKGLYSSNPGGTFLVTCVTEGSYRQRGGKERKIIENMYKLALVPRYEPK